MVDLGGVVFLEEVSLGTRFEVSKRVFSSLSLFPVCGLRCQPSALSFQPQLPDLPAATLHCDGDGLIHPQL